MLTAKHLFAKKGFYATPTALIAKQAKVSNGILFHYFPTKEALIRAMYFDIKERIFSYAISQIYNGATLKESFYTLWLAAVEWYLESPEDFEFMLQYENSPYFSPKIEREQKYAQLSIDLISQGLEQGLLKHLDPYFVFRLLFGMVDSTVKFLRDNRELENDFEYKTRLFELAWDAIKK
jgi:AcrR family transcriptional regulator